jgi:hypothetical protein
MGIKIHHHRPTATIPPSITRTNPLLDHTPPPAYQAAQFRRLLHTHTHTHILTRTTLSCPVVWLSGFGIVSLSALCTTTENKENKEKKKTKEKRKGLSGICFFGGYGSWEHCVNLSRAVFVFACFWWLACVALRTLELLPTAFRTGCGAVGFVVVVVVVVVIVGGHWGGMGLGCVFVSLVLGFFLLLYCINYLSIYLPFRVGDVGQRAEPQTKIKGLERIL